MSQECHPLHQAHNVPSSETEWFNKSGLAFSYRSNASDATTTPLNFGIDNDNNLIVLRSDLHHAWDQRDFIFVPKQTKEGSKIMVHCWNEDMVTRYHNVPLQGFVRRDFRLARFAWALLPRALIPFLLATKDTRMTWTRNEHGDLNSQKTTESNVRSLPTRLFSTVQVPRSASRIMMGSRLSLHGETRLEVLIEASTHV